MGFVLHPKAAEALNETAETLVRMVRVMPRDGPDGGVVPPVFAPKLEDIKQLVAVSHVDPETGEICGRWFESADGMRGLDNVRCDRLNDVAAKLARQEPFRRRVSDRFIADEIFGWVARRFRGAEPRSAAEALCEAAEAAVEEREIWVPIASLHVEAPVQIGNVRFQTVTPEMFDRWTEAVVELQPDHEEAVRAWFLRERKPAQGYAVGVVRLTAEQEHAKRVAMMETERSLSVLRAFSPSVLSAQAAPCVPRGQERHPTRHWWEFDDGIPRFASEVIDQVSQPWLLQAAYFKELQQLGIGHMSSLLTQERLKPFETDVLAAFELYARSPLTDTITDRIVYVTVSLESILLKNSSEPIQSNLGERLAFCIGRNLQERKRIVRNLKNVYETRSRFLHHGKAGKEERECRDEFLINAWSFFCQLAQSVGTKRFKTKSEFLEALDDRRLT